VATTGAQFAILVIPAAPQIAVPQQGRNWYCDRPNQELAAFLEVEGIPYVDVLEEFRDHSLAGGEALFYNRDFHMNIAGHQLAGQLLYQFVIEIYE
jgi:lysophospholipase L1-like esterase